MHNCGKSFPVYRVGSRPRVNSSVLHRQRRIKLKLRRKNRRWRNWRKILKSFRIKSVSNVKIWEESTLLGKTKPISLNKFEFWKIGWIKQIRNLMKLLHRIRSYGRK